MGKYKNEMDIKMLKRARSNISVSKTYIRKEERVGFCRNKKHYGYVSAGIIKEHECLKKSCPYLCKYENHKYWISRYIDKHKREIEQEYELFKKTCEKAKKGEVYSIRSESKINFYCGCKDFYIKELKYPKGEKGEFNISSYIDDINMEIKKATMRNRKLTSEEIFTRESRIRADRISDVIKRYNVDIKELSKRSRISEKEMVGYLEYSSNIKKKKYDLIRKTLLKMYKGDEELVSSINNSLSWFVSKKKVLRRTDVWFD